MMNLAKPFAVPKYNKSSYAIVQVIPARLSCVAWSRSKIHRPNVFMGSDEPDSENFYPRVIVYECNEVLR